MIRPTMMRPRQFLWVPVSRLRFLAIATGLLGSLALVEFVMLWLMTRGRIL